MALRAMTTSDQEVVARVKQRAFEANNQAKSSSGLQREAVYREKDAAINYLLERGFGVVNSVDWSREDAVIGVTFAGGGRLHIVMSGLSRLAFRAVRRQLSGRRAPRAAASYANRFARAAA